MKKNKRGKEERKNDDNNKHMDKGKEEGDTKTMTTKIKKRRKRRRRRRRTQHQFDFHETRLKIAFLQLTSGAHITVSKYGCSWNDRRQPVFAVTSLFTRFNFVARLSRYLRY